MGTDYRFTVKRKADNKTIAIFYYNGIKSLSDVYVRNLKLDLDCIRGEDTNQFRFEAQDVANDINTLRKEVDAAYHKIFEKKLLVPMSANSDIKFEIESDIKDLENDVEYFLDGIEALAGLRATLRTIVEDMVECNKTDDNDEEHHCAYVYNAEGLPKNENGYDPHLWLDDVYVEVKACC